MTRRSEITRITLLLLLTTILLISPGVPARAQSIEVLETQVTHAFGSQVTFWARVSLPEAPEEALVFYRASGDTQTFSGILSVQGDQVSFVHDLTRSPLRAFAEVEYWFGFRLHGAENIISPTYTFLYDDNRFQWRQLQSNPITIYWYDGDLAFGQVALDTAQVGLEKARTWFDFPEVSDLRLYLYANAAEMQSTLQLGGMSLVGGHTSPDLGVVMISLPPGPEHQVEVEQKIPHELAHILLYQKLGSGYAHLPTWLSEGLASKIEFFPNPDYHVILVDALEREALLPMAALCNGFPLDASSFYLSYAQSESFVGYLFDQFGKSGIENLLAQYANGVDCERGAELALGSTLSELDEQWQEARLGTPPQPLVRSDHPLLPWVMLFVVVLIIPLAPVLYTLARAGKLKKVSAREVLHE